MYAISAIVGRSQPFLVRLRSPYSCLIKRGRLNSPGKPPQECGNSSQGFRILFGKYLYITNTITTAALMGLADLLQQEIENNGAGIPRFTYNWTRNIRMTEIGAVQGISSHIFYMFLDKYFPGNELSTVARKLMIDQALFAPFCICIFFVGLRYLSGELEGSWQELKEKFLLVYMVDCAVWIPSQFINFYLLHPKYRVLYLSFVSVLYNMFLSYIKHNNVTSY